MKGDNMIKTSLVFLYGLIRCILWEIPLLIILFLATNLTKFVIWCIKDGQIDDSTFKVLIICMVGLALCGCISASASTGIEAQAKQEAEQGSSQETTSTDRVKLEIETTTITTPDGSVITVGGGSAETGSKTTQQSDQLNKIEQSLEMQGKASSSSSFNITMLVILAGILAFVLVAFELWRIKIGRF